MRPEQRGHVMRRRLLVILGGMQDRGGPPHVFTVPVGLHQEVDDTRRRDHGDGIDGGLLVEQQHLLEADVADLGCLAQGRASGGQRHLAVGSPRQRGHIVDLMVTEPWQCLRANLGLPRVALRLLVQTDVRAQQWVHRNRATTMCWGFLTIARQQQRTMCPGRQRRVHQAPVWVEHREVHRGARAVQIRQEVAQSVRQRLLAAHAGQCGYRHVEAVGGLLDGMSEQGVWRQLGENPVAVFKRGLHRRGEPHRVPQVVRPVPGVAHRLVARVEQRRRIVRNFRRHRAELGQDIGQLVEDRIDLGGVRGDVDGHLAGHYVALLPGRDEIANRLGCAADDGGLRGGHHRDHDVVDATSHQF